MVANKNIYITTNCMQKGHEDSDQLFNTSGSYDYDLQAQTSQLINQVFNSDNYEPVYNPAHTKAKEEHYQQVKEKVNKLHKSKLHHHHRIYQNLSDKDLSPSFLQFLTRAQQKVDNRNKWIEKMQKQQDEREVKDLKDVPDILRGSREKIQPIFARCIDLQKEKERKLEQKRINKNRVQTEAIQKLSFKPTVNPGTRQRTFQQYIADKEAWVRQRQEEIDMKRMTVEVEKLSECTFTPILVSKFNKINSRIIPGQKVEERLLRSLEKTTNKTHRN